jgi:O-antigen/teichoic acid export membrane protein
MSRSRRAIWGYATVLLFIVVTAATSLLATPLLLRDDWLGKERFGAYRMVLDWCGYLTLLDLGLGGALAPLLAQALGRGDRQALRRVLATGTRAYLGLTLLALTVGLAMTPLIVAQVRVDPKYVADLRWGWIASLLGLLPLALAPLRTLGDARQRGYWINLLLTAQCLLITALALLWARAGLGITGQGLAYSVGALVFYGMLTWDTLRLDRSTIGEVLITPTDSKTWRMLAALCVPTLLLNLCGRISLMTDNIVCGGILGPAAVASLVITQRLATLALSVLQAVGSASWAALAELNAQGDRETFRRRLVELTSVVVILGIAGLGPIVAYNHHFVNLWMRPRNGPPGKLLVEYGGDPIILVAALNALLQGLLSLWGWCFGGTGQQRRLVVPLAFSAVINLTASILLTRWLGMIGPLLGTTVAFLAVNLWCLPLLLRRVFGVALTKLAQALAVPLAWGLPYTALLWWWAHAHKPWGWVGLAAEMTLAALGFLALSAGVILSPTDRSLWRLRWAGLWPHRAESETPTAVS